MSPENRSSRVAALAFAAFAVLIALRDVNYELFLKETEQYIAFAFLVCVTIATMGAVIVTSRGGWPALARKVRSKGAMSRAGLLGLLSGALYGTGFYLVSIMGAGSFHTINYGLMPVAAAVVGRFVFRSTIPSTFWLAFCTYLVGFALLMSTTEEMSGFAYAGFAMLVPVVTAICDALTKWLLDPSGPARLTPSEALVVRFVPASAALGVYAVLAGKSLAINNVAPALAVAVLCGFVPLGLLCVGLVRSSMPKYAVWLFLIPAIAFFGTLHVHPGFVKPLPITGALLIMAGVVICKTPLGERLVALFRRQSPKVIHPQSPFSDSGATLCTSGWQPVVLQVMPPNNSDVGTSASGTVDQR